MINEGLTLLNLRAAGNVLPIFGSQDIKKWMKMAKAATEVETPCLSRQIGVVIADPKTGSLVSSGHNGPPNDVPCDHDGYLKEVVWPQLTSQEKRYAKADTCDGFVKNYAGCGTCPRKIIGAPSGQRLELCTCVHGETAAIVNAHRSVQGCWMFCWCGVPCIECTKLIVKSHIAVVVAIDHGLQDYSPYSSRWMFKNSNTDLILAKPELFE